MRRDQLQPLTELAASLGIQTSYVDMTGRRRPAGPATLAAVAKALGVDVSGGGGAAESLARLRRARLERWLEPVQVQWIGVQHGLRLRVPEGLCSKPLEVEWELEGGDSCKRAIRQGKGSKTRRRGRSAEDSWVEIHLPPPRVLPMGYHRVQVWIGDRPSSSTIIVAPPRCYRPPGTRRQYGVFAPLYGLHSERSWGIGDYADLERWLAWVGEAGGSFVGTLPLLPAFLDAPCEPSPYSPVTRLGWNEVFLDLESLPELAECPAARRVMESAAFRRQREALRRAHEVDYGMAMELKREVLMHLSRTFFRRQSSRRQEFEAFLREHPHIADYAQFRAVGERLGRAWERWPNRLRTGCLRSGDGSPVVERYHAFVQWLAHSQMTQVADTARRHRVSLYLDMPLGTHRDGYDAWRYQNLFALGAAGGAPPDPVFTQGQNWGFAPMHPEQSREQGHAYLAAYLRHHLRHAGMLRFDHVMGLHRLYWVPQGLPASQGAYVRYPAEEFYAVLCLESHRHRAVIVGENLGTVPPEVDRALARHRVAGMYVAQYEFRAPPRRPLRPVPGQVVASVNTHDMPPFAAWVLGLDLEDRRDLGLLSRANVQGERKLRKAIMASLRKSLPAPAEFADNSAQAGLLLQGLLRYLGRSKARWLLLNIEDFWLEVLPQNVPGTSIERVNWRRRLRMSLEDLARDPGLAQWLALVRCWRRQP